MATETMVAEPREDLEVVEGTEREDAAGEEDGLHIRSLRVQGFRCFEDIAINRFGRVNLIAGKNGSGKSSLLEAVRVYSERGSSAALRQVLISRDEVDEDEGNRRDARLAYDWGALFHGRELRFDRSIQIGQLVNGRQVTITPVSGSYPELRAGERLDLGFIDEETTYLRVSVDGAERYIAIEPRTRLNAARRFAEPSRRMGGQFDEFPEKITCVSQGTNVVDNWELAEMWDEVALTKTVSIATELVHIVVGREVISAAAIGGRRRSDHPPKTLVLLAESDHPVPLRSLGDGATRAFGYALAIANASGGILLIDEIENGIHYTVMPEFWRMIFNAARDHDVQVFATTHSWDCIRAFAKVIDDDEVEDAILIRLDKTRITKRDRAVEYAPEDIVAAARYGVEVR